MTLRALFSLLLLLPAQLGLADSKFNYPGGLSELRIEKLSSDFPESKFGLNDTLIMEAKNHWRVLVGLDLSLLPGEYVVYFKSGIEGASGEHHKINVAQKTYPFVQADAADSSLVTDYYSLPELSGIDFNNSQQPSFPFRLPATGDWINQFGHQWFDQSQQEIKSNNAVSLSSTKLVSVVAPYNAIVSNILMDENQLATLVLDHGRGLYSVLRGLTDLTVDLGNGVVQGAVLGRMPQGLAESEPNKLVWQAVMNGVPINPMLLLRLDAEDDAQ